ncbi:MAG: hypothetical protein HRU20_30400, partial [Pseudomonadales bacterium]|nr:hypothetical protein [Pseudomonadales bacterium]
MIIAPYEYSFSHLRKYLAVYIFFSLSLFSIPILSNHPSATRIEGVINSYVKGSGDVLSGASTIEYIGSFRGANASIAAGDTLLLLQSQGAEIDASNTDKYGDGVGDGSNISLVETAAHGSSNYAGGLISQTAGTFEFVQVVQVVGSEITLAAPLNNTFYDSAAANWQIVVVPDYGVNGVKFEQDVKPLAWDGDTGGVVVVYSLGGEIDFNGKKIKAQALGFRGGVESNHSATKDNIANVAEGPGNFTGGKGEGIAGTPRYIWDGISEIDEGVSTLPGGDYGRGAPGNAGGGAGPHNSGGGGGSNEAKSGSGEEGCVGGTPQHYAGYGGQSILSGANMGGGGGSGEANNKNWNYGGVGGGIVFIRAATAKGSGVIDVSGGKGVDSDGSAPGSNGADGGGGGGAAG